MNISKPPNQLYRFRNSYMESSWFKTWEQMRPDYPTRVKFYNEILIPSKHAEFKDGSWWFSRTFFDAIQLEPEVVKAWMLLVG